MDKIPIIFFGTHDFATTILQGLVNSPLFDIKLVITQPDRPAGRKKELVSPPTKIIAEKYQIPVQQPKSLQSSVFSLQSCGLAIVAQYGLLIPQNILNIPQHGTLNVHTSLLPKYRGASPIQSALINGEEKTGVTIIKMDEGLDSGPILLQKKINILPNETYLKLDKRLANVGLELLLEATPKYISGELQPTPQDDSQATICKKLTREDGKINWNKTTREIYNLYRGLTPWPGIWTTWQDKRLKLLKIKPAKTNIATGKVNIQDGILRIGTKDASIETLELQPEGKPEMDVKTFLNGYKHINNVSLITDH